MDIVKWILDAAKKNGATLAGIASVDALSVSASHRIYSILGDCPEPGTVTGKNVLQDKRIFNWPDTAKSVLVIALSHPEDKPQLDWSDGRETFGNRILIDIINRTSRLIEDNLKLKTYKLHYYVEKGGVFLKDAAVLAGLGCIGRNNMLLTPSYGPRIRLRALLIDSEIYPTGPISFDPCAECKALCRSVCPENAMDTKAPIFRQIDISDGLPGRDGFYNRESCNTRMEKDISESRNRRFGKQSPIKYCRKCEFICPVGKKKRVKTPYSQVVVRTERTVSSHTF